METLKPWIVQHKYGFSKEYSQFIIEKIINVITYTNCGKCFIELFCLIARYFECMK